MKKIIAVAIIALLGTFSNSLFAQHEASTIKLEQTKGEFTIQSLTLDEGEYVFEIVNNGVDHEVGFVVAPEGKTDQEHHIKEAYVTKTAKNGQTSTSKTVKLKKGNYVYFCPLNPTPQYKLTVK